MWNVIGFKNIINKYLDYFFVISDTSGCKTCIVKSVVSVTSLLKKKIDTWVILEILQILLYELYILTCQQLQKKKLFIMFVREINHVPIDGSSNTFVMWIK